MKTKKIVGTKEQRKFMRKAIEESKKSLTLKEGGCFGCVIVKDNKIVAVAHNQVIKNNDPTCHGEIQAIRLASQKLKNFDLGGCELYTSAMPCPMCLGAIYWANIDKVFAGATARDTGKIGFADDYIYEIIQGTYEGEKEIPIYNLLRKEAVKVQKDYYKLQDKQMY